MDTRKIILLILFFFGISVYYIDTSHILTRFQQDSSKRKYTCEIVRAEQGWRIIPNKEYLTDSYWHDYIHCDSIYPSCQEAMLTLERFGWRNMPVTANTDRHTRTYYIMADKTCSNRFQSDWRQLMQNYNNP